VMTREGMGQDDVPDLLYLNFKEIDFVSHVWSMNSPEMEDAVVAQDEALKALVTYLNERVGKGNWVLGLTADHASMPDPAASGGYQISTGPMQVMINEKFDSDDDDTPIVALMQPTQAFINVDELKEGGYTLDDVARYMMTFTQTQTAGGGVVPNPGQENDTVMQAAFPSALMPDLPCLPEARE
jgi:Type I phosphodiesterase / nucleotide pyrophosphatase